VGDFVDGLVESGELSLDPSRLYLTGVSMGGYGTWLAGSGTVGFKSGGAEPSSKLRPRFAAIAPVCGAGSADPATLDGVPVWAFHGANDVVVPVGVSDETIQALRQRRSNTNEDYPEVKYTRYEVAPAPTGWESYAGHASWKLAYEGPELFEWMLRFRNAP